MAAKKRGIHPHWQKNPYDKRLGKAERQAQAGAVDFVRPSMTPRASITPPQLNVGHYERGWRLTIRPTLSGVACRPATHSRA